MEGRVDNRQAEKDRRTLYQALAMHPQWQRVKADLILFACSEKDPAVRCGRLDLLAYLEDSIIGSVPEED